MATNKLVRITFSTQDRIKTPQDTTTNFRINLKDVFNSGQSGRKIKMAVNRARIPGTWYNVNRLTNVFEVYYSKGGGPVANFTVTLPIGNYNVAQIATELSDQFTTATGDSITFAYDNNLGVYSIQQASGATYEFVFVFNDPSKQNTAGNSASPFLGYPVSALTAVGSGSPFFSPTAGSQFTSGIITVTSSVNPTALTGRVDVTWPSSLVIRGSLGTINTYDSQYESSGLIFETISIPGGAPNADVIYYASDPIDLAIEVINPFSTFINFRLTDIRNNEIDLNKHDWDFDIVAQWEV